MANCGVLSGKPGQVNLLCTIYENRPIYRRPLQEQIFFYCAKTMLGVVDQSITNLLSFPPLDAQNGPSQDGVYLAERRKWYHTFLKSGSPLGSINPTMVSSFYDNSGNPLYDWIPHQEFYLDGSLFNTDSWSFLDWIQSTLLGTDLSLVQWNYAKESIGDETNQGGGDGNSSSASGAFSGPWATQRLMPCMTNNSITAPLHFRAIKRTPLYQGEDFWVEFHRQAFDTDNPVLFNINAAIDNLEMRSEFQYLDSALANYLSPDNFLINAGVVNVAPAVAPALNGVPTLDSIIQNDLRTQAYYMIEIGAGTGSGGGSSTVPNVGESSGSSGFDDEHHYFIIIAEKGYPMFVHAGRPFTITQVFNSGPDQGEVNIAQPNEDISDLISLYTISSKELLSKSKLRVTVRNHMQKLFITFAGYEDLPWIIERTEIQQTNNTGDVTQDFTVVNRPAIVPASKIAIYAGNIKCSFAFNPLVYSDTAAIQIPQSIHVKGPVSSTDINLWLREKNSVHQDNPNDDPSTWSQVWYQDSQQYLEYIPAQGGANNQYASNPPVTLDMRAPMVATSKDPSFTNMNELATISVYPVGDTGTPGSINPNQSSSASFFVEVDLFAGNRTFPVYDGFQFTLENCVTPILTGYRLFIPPFGTSYQTTECDASYLVKDFNETWTAEDFYKITHSGDITFTATAGVPMPTSSVLGLPLLPVDTLISLSATTFYVRIRLWWQNGFLDPVIINPALSRNYDDYVVFSGFCYGGDVNQVDGQIVMNCQILDYWEILKCQPFVNAPFFDGMRDFNAVYDILQLAGFRDGVWDEYATSGFYTIVDQWAPAGLLLAMVNDASGNFFTVNYPVTANTTEKVTVAEYALPGDYSPLTQMTHRPGEYSMMDEYITKIAKLSGKVAYFDRYGIFHYENQQDEVYYYQGLPVPTSLIQANFYASPLAITSQPTGPYYVTIGEYTYSRGVADVVNQIQIISTDPNGDLLMGGDVNYASITDAYQPGFVGFPKIAIQTDGVFGSDAAVQDALNKYKARMYVPPLYVKFAAYGLFNLKPLDIITFTGLPQDALLRPGYCPQNAPFRIVSIRTHAKPGDESNPNEWTSHFECEWIFNANLSSLNEPQPP